MPVLKALLVDDDEQRGLGLAETALAVVRDSLFLQATKLYGNAAGAELAHQVVINPGQHGVVRPHNAVLITPFLQPTLLLALKFGVAFPPLRLLLSFLLLCCRIRKSLGSRAHGLLDDIDLLGSAGIHNLIELAGTGLPVLC